MPTSVCLTIRRSTSSCLRRHPAFAHSTSPTQSMRESMSLRRKPSCVDPAGYRVCLSADQKARENKTAIVTGTQYRRQTNYVEAIKRIHDGVIGDIISATARYCSNGIWFKARTPEMSDTQYQLFNWMHFIWLSGDQITEQAVHNIDALNWIMGGPPETCFGGGGRFTRPEGSEMWDSVSVDYVYPGNRMLSFKCRQIPGYEE